MVVGHVHVAELGREPVVELVLERGKHRLDGVLHQAGARLHVLHAREPCVVRRRGDADHARVDAEGRADVLARDLAQRRELEVGEREAQRLDVLDRAEEGGRAALAPVDDAGLVAVLHRLRVLLRRLVREHHGEGRRAVVRHHLPDVVARLVVRHQGLQCRRPARIAEHVRLERGLHLEVAEVQDVGRVRRHDDAVPVAVVVASRIALRVDPHGLQRLGVDGPEARHAAARALHLEQGVPVAEEVDREPRPELARREARGRIVEHLLQRMRLRHPARLVAPLPQDDERHGRHKVGNHADTGVDDGMGIEATRADRRAVGLVFARVGGAHQHGLRVPALEVRIGQGDDRPFGRVIPSSQHAKRGCHTRQYVRLMQYEPPRNRLASLRATTLLQNARPRKGVLQNARPRTRPGLS